MQRQPAGSSGRQLTCGRHRTSVLWTCPQEYIPSVPSVQSSYLQSIQWPCDKVKLCQTAAKSHCPHLCSSGLVAFCLPFSWPVRPRPEDEFDSTTEAFIYNVPKFGWQHTQASQNLPRRLVKIHAKLFSSFALFSCCLLNFFFLIFKLLSRWKMGHLKWRQ